MSTSEPAIPRQSTSYSQINGASHVVSWGRLPGKACVSTSESEKEQPDLGSPPGTGRWMLTHTSGHAT